AVKYVKDRRIRQGRYYVKAVKYVKDGTNAKEMAPGPRTLQNALHQILVPDNAPFRVLSFPVRRTNPHPHSNSMPQRYRCRRFALRFKSYRGSTPYHGSKPCRGSKPSHVYCRWSSEGHKAPHESLHASTSRSLRRTL
ncbi:hypothetical protein MMC31_000656, partial [Peltigera leucophlebia]|nr:hypothetical protein [Peltigera leucophlebia]